MTQETKNTILFINNPPKFKLIYSVKKFDFKMV